MKILKEMIRQSEVLYKRIKLSINQMRLDYIIDEMEMLDLKAMQNSRRIEKIIVDLKELERYKEKLYPEKDIVETPVS